MCVWGVHSEQFHYEYDIKVKLVTLVEGDPKAPFSIATTLRCREGATPFPGLLHFTLDPYLILLSFKKGGVNYHFLSLWYDLTRDWTQVSRTISESSTDYANEQLNKNTESFYFITLVFNFLLRNQTKLPLLEPHLYLTNEICKTLVWLDLG